MTFIMNTVMLIHCAMLNTISYISPYLLIVLAIIVTATIMICICTQQFYPDWAVEHYEPVLLMIRNIANPSPSDPFFPLFRHKVSSCNKTVYTILADCMQVDLAGNASLRITL
jgi:hypothetical protein